MTSESFGRPASQTGSQAKSAASRSGANTTNASRKNDVHSICAFWIAQRCFGLDTELVGEIVSVEDRTPVPLAPPAVHGIFNLRGEPLPLVSLADILGIARNDTRPKAVTAMVLRARDIAAGLSIDRVEAILPMDRNALTPPTNAAEDSAILGFFEVASERISTVISVLDPAALLEKLAQLRYSRGSNGVS